MSRVVRTNEINIATSSTPETLSNIPTRYVSIWRIELPITGLRIA